ncbi:MAG: hypothetical protein ACRDD7_08030 [Peptostreptococcaceae bacterium]
MKLDKYEKIVSGFFILLFIGIVVILNIDFSGHEMKFEEDEIRINITNIKIEDIADIELIDEVYIGNKIKGTNTFTYFRGSAQLENDTKGLVYIYNKSKPYIRITTKDKIIIYNDKKSYETKETYEKLMNIYNIKDTASISENRIIPEDSKYTSKDKIVSFIAIMPVVVVFIGMGIYALNKKTPVHFWAGITVKSEEISDVKSYNKANGIMWITVGLSFIIFPIITSMVEGISTMILGLIPMFEVIGMMVCYQLIYNKYKVK